MCRHCQGRLWLDPPNLDGRQSHRSRAPDEEVRRWRHDTNTARRSKRRWPQASSLWRGYWGTLAKS